MSGTANDAFVHNWWEAWWLEDYSWEGLAKREVLGKPTSGGPLQDYWRRDPLSGKLRSDKVMKHAKELVEHEGELFHIAHLPPKGRLGGRTWKSDLDSPEWVHLETLLVKRLEYGGDTKFGPKGQLIGPDRRAQLTGTVVRRALSTLKPPTDVLHIKAKNMATLGVADYSYASFGQSARFDWSLFCSAARFDNTTFLGEANFDNSLHCGETTFSRASFAGLAAFIDARFRRKAFFRHEATFNGDVWFDRAVFEQLVTFNTARFNGDMDFTGAEFGNVALFEGIKWPQEARHWHSAFDRSLFRGKLSLSGSGFGSFAAFDGATVERGMQIDDPLTEMAANEQFRKERELALTSADCDHVEEKEKWGVKALQQALDTHKGTCRDERLRQLERGCRVLKLAMSGAANKSLEQLLYRFELQARRAQRKLRFGEKFFSDLYGLTSDYGASIWRPFASVAVLILAFAALYWAYAGFVDSLSDTTVLAGSWSDQAVDAADYSWTNVFKPLSGLSEVRPTDATNSMIRVLQTGAGDGWAFVLKVLATFESLLAVVLVFLFGLAVRRRFQII